MGEMVAWMLVSRDDDYAKLLDVARVVLQQLKVASAEVRLPEFRGPCDERRWLRDGSVVDTRKLVHLIQRDFEERMFTCRFHCDDGTALETYFDASLLIHTALDLRSVILDNKIEDIEVFRTDWCVLPLTKYSTVRNALAEELHSRITRGMLPVVVEQWARGAFGSAASFPRNHESVEEIIQQLKPRSFVILFDEADLLTYDSLDEALFDEINTVPSDAPTIWPGYVIPSANADLIWHEAYKTIDWDEIASLPEIHSASGICIIAAGRWFDDPLPPRFVVPDTDGVVRALGGVGPAEVPPLTRSR